ncbi:hypothetical protein O9G_005989, partial [Rozella allomycis CSF55]
MFQEKITAHNFQDKCSITQDLSENSVLVAIDGRGVYRYSISEARIINSFDVSPNTVFLKVVPVNERNCVCITKKGVILVSLDSVTVQSANLDRKPLSVLNAGDNLVLIIFSDE